jgi:hypothetical protein
MKAWFDEPQELLNVDKVSEFWPTGEQTPEDRVNATSRFVIYTTCILYLTRRDPRVFVLGATVLSVVYVLYKSKMVKEGYGMKTVCGQKCQRPTQDNPMGNVLMSDYVDAPNRLEACYYATVKPNAGATVSYDSGRSRSPLPKYQRNGLARQFISNPVTKIPGDQTAFAEWLYGPKNGPMCKSNTRFCDPNARGVQLEAFAGIGHDGDIRGPRGGTYS